MVDGINGKFNKSLNFFTQNELTKGEEATEVKKEDVPVGKQGETKEVGDELLDPRYFANALGFVRQTSALPKADAAELSEMYQRAGIKAPLPTAAQYASVANITTSFQRGIDTLSTTNNAERLFDSEEFKELNKQFGIS